MTLLIKNIGLLVGIEQHQGRVLKGKEMDTVASLADAFLLIKNGLIADFGAMSTISTAAVASKQQIDASGKIVMPCWCDSHTHIVYAGSREKEFADRISGLSYEEIAARGGGILNSANRLRNTSEEELIASALVRLDEIKSQGTGAVEIKSGYGLSKDSELKMLRVIKKLKAISKLTIRSTFLGAHAIPAEYKDRRGEYIKMLTDELLPQIQHEGLADYCDVFCEKNYFTKDETIHILNTAKKLGIAGKIHAEQLSHSGGIEAGVACEAISVDHLEYANENDIRLLKNSTTIPTILPGAQFFLQLPHPPARQMIDAGLPLAIASDFNPGSSPSGNMNLMGALSCVQYKLTPEEVFNASTVNTAWAMGLGATHGSIAIGKVANVFITKKMNSIAMIPYSFGSNPVEQVILKGEVQ